MAKNYEVAFTLAGRVAASFKNATTGAGAALDGLSAKIKGLDKGKADISRWRTLKAEIKTTADQFAAAQERVRLLAQGMAGIASPTKAMTREFETAKRQAGGLKDKLEGQRAQLHTLRGALASAGISTRDLVGKQKELAAAADKARAAQAALQGVMLKQQAVQNTRGQKRMELLDAYALARSLAAPIAAAVEFESAMQGIARQVEGAKDAGGNFTPVYHDMARQIQMLGRELPIATTEIADMVTAGARMGVAREELIGFTRDAAMMATAFEAPAGELAESMGKIANNFKIPVTQIRGLADSINYLDDNAISKGADIIDVLQRISGTVATVKMDAKDAAALASTLLTSGMTAETSGTAINAIVGRFAAAEKGTAKLKRAMAELGISTKAVQQGMQTDATGTMLGVLEKIRTMPKAEQMGILIDLVGREHAPTLAKLASNTEEFRRQLELANGEAAKGSMGREMAVRMKGTAAQTQLLKNNVSELGVNLGTALLPGVNAASGGLSTMSGGLATAAQKYPKVTSAITGTIAALIALKIASIGLGYSWTFVQGGALMLKKAMLTMRAASLASTASTITATAAQWGLNAAMTASPIGLVVAGVAALAGAGLLIYKYWEPISVFFQGFWSGMVTGLAPVRAAFAPLAPMFSAIGGAISAAFGWVSKLLEPLQLTASGFDRAMSAGQAFGEIVGKVLNVLLAPLKAVGWAVGKIAGAVGGGGGGAASSADTDLPNIPMYGTGGFFNTPHLAVVGDKPETIIPHKSTPGNLAMWASAGRALGVGPGAGGGGGAVVNYSPQITIAGNADAGTVGQALEMSEARLRAMIERVMGQDRRLAMA